jgi:hypothetical protein
VLSPVWHISCLSLRCWRYKDMTPQTSQTDTNLQAELDRLTLFRLSVDARSRQGFFGGGESHRWITGGPPFTPVSSNGPWNSR